MLQIVELNGGDSSSAQVRESRGCVVITPTEELTAKEMKVLVQRWRFVRLGLRARSNMLLFCSVRFCNCTSSCQLARSNSNDVKCPLVRLPFLWAHFAFPALSGLLHS
jgi:hypothetical protein